MTNHEHVNILLSFVFDMKGLDMMSYFGKENIRSIVTVK